MTSWWNYFLGGRPAPAPVNATASAQVDNAETEPVGPPRLGAAGTPDFEAAAHPPERTYNNVIVDDPAETALPRPRDSALPFFLWTIALHHPLTAVAGLGLAGGATLFGMGFLGARAARFALQGDRLGRAGAHDPETLRNVVVDMERRLADDIGTMRAENRINWQGFAQHFGPPPGQRRMGADRNLRPSLVHEVVGSQAKEWELAQAKARRHKGKVEDAGEGKTHGPITEQALAGYRNATAPVDTSPARGEAPMAELLAHPDGPRYLDNLVEQNEVLSNTLRERDRELQALREEHKKLKARIEEKEKEEPQPAPTPSRSSSLPSANNVDMTGPMLAQTRPMTNVEPDTIPGPTPRPRSAEPEPEPEPEPTTRAATAQPDFSFADINAGLRELRERHQREAPAETAPPSSTASTWQEQELGSESDATVNVAQQDAPAAPQTSEDDAHDQVLDFESDSDGAAASWDSGSEPSVVDEVQRAVDHSTSSDTAASPGGTAQSGKSKRKRRNSAPASVTSSDDGSATEAEVTTEGSEAADLRRAITESLNPQARPSSPRPPAQGEGGPSTWAGRRAPSPSPSPSSADAAQSTAPPSPGVRRSFVLQDEITVPFANNEWTTARITLKLSQDAEAEQSGPGWEYRRRQARSRTYNTTAELYITDDVHLIKFDNALWRVVRDGDDYLVQGKLGE